MLQQPRPLRLRQALCLAAVLVSCSAAHADEFDLLRERWLTRLTGGAAISATDPDIAGAIRALSASAQAHWDAMDKSPGRTSLWVDQANRSKSATVTGSYNRLSAMAVAYASAGSGLQGNAALAQDIVAALDWLHANRYNPGISAIDNWYDWEIGAPLALNNIMTLMYGQLSETQRGNYLAAIDKFVPDATRRTVQPSLQETGANRLDKALVVSLRGILGKSAARIAHGRDAISQTLLYVSSGDGFYRDGSFVQHGYVPYTASYGLVLMDDMSKLLYLLGESSWAVGDPNVANVYDWVHRAYRPLMHDGAMMDAVKGRALARQGTSDHSSGRSLMVSLVRLAQGAPADQAAAIKALVKGWLQRDGTLNEPCFSALPREVAAQCAAIPVYEYGLLKTLLADPAVQPAAEPVGAKLFAGMDRAVQHGPGFAVGISLFSNRMSAFEYGNGENATGWWTGMGMVNLYNADQTQYGGNYWPTVDIFRLAGTTTDRSAGTLVAWKNYKNISNWVGGAELDGRFAVATLDFGTSGVTGTSLKAKKSWFLFGDKLLAVGAAINSGSGRAIETIVENRKLNAEGSNALTVNGTLKPIDNGWSEAMTGVRWAHLAGSVPGADIGYHFPDAPAVNGLRQLRSGSWSSLSSAESPTLVSNSFLSLALPHGINPSAGTYSYVLLPQRSADQVAAYADRPTVTVLARTTDLLAARDSEQGLVGANFLTNTSKTLSLNGAPYLITSTKASILTQEVGEMLSLSVADPTQANTAASATAGLIAVEIKRDAAELLAADAGVTVTQLSPSIKLSVNVDKAGGKSFTARFRLKDLVAPVLSAAVIGERGVVQLSAQASDGVAVSRVEFLVDQVLVATVATPPFAASLDSFTLANGPHRLTARAYDAAGNVGSSDEVVFNISNPVDVSAQAGFAISGLAYNRVAQTFSGQVKVSNTGTQALSGPLHLVLGGLSAGVSLSNAAGTLVGQPRLTVGSAGLALGASVSVPVIFHNPSKAAIQYQPRLYSGAL